MCCIGNGQSVLCIPCPFDMRYSSIFTLTCPVVDRSQLRSNGHQRTHTGYLQDAERTRIRQTAYQPTSNGLHWNLYHVYPVASVQSFKHVQNLPTDKAGQNGHQLTWNAFTTRGTNKKHMRTDMNGQRNLLSVSAILKGVTET